MNAIALRGLLKKKGDVFYIIPATKADKTLIGNYADLAEDKYITIQMKSGSGSKSYSQVKTAWALIKMLFIANKGRKPTTSEADLFYESLLEEYSDKKLVEDVLHHKMKEVPVTMSEMSKLQLARFMQIIIQLLHENTQEMLTSADDLVEIQELFTEWQEYLSLQEVDPTDFNEDGEYLSIEEYRQTHKYSYASGRTCGEDGTDLEFAHIVSRGASAAFENCCWNGMMLTHEEHLEIMHEEGFNSLIARYPHIRGRVQRAMNLAKHLYKVIEKEQIEI